MQLRLCLLTSIFHLFLFFKAPDKAYNIHPFIVTPPQRNIAGSTINLQPLKHINYTSDPVFYVSGTPAPHPHPPHPRTRSTYKKSKQKGIVSFNPFTFAMPVASWLQHAHDSGFPHSNNCVLTLDHCKYLIRPRPACQSVIQQQFGIVRSWVHALELTSFTFSHSKHVEKWRQIPGRLIWVLTHQWSQLKFYQLINLFQTDQRVCCWVRWWW